MIIGAILFFGLLSMTTAFLTTVFANVTALWSILAIVIFMGLGLLFFPKTRGIGTGVILTGIVLMVAIEALAPYQVVLQTVVSGVLAVLGLVLVKRPMLRFVRNDERSGNPSLPVWARWVLRLI